MGKYLKMADVFPVEIKTDDESGSLICDEDGIILESFAGDKVADYTLHAINSHDELVAEVERLRMMISECYPYIRGKADWGTDREVDLANRLFDAAK